MIEYTFIPLIATACYSFLLLAFLAAKKNPIVNSFILMLIIFTLWSGGSLLMRIQFLDATKIWYDLSLAGIILAPYAVLSYVKNTGQLKRNLIDYVLLGFSIVTIVINTIWEIFLEAPEMIVNEIGQTIFVYHASWTAVFLFVFPALFVIYTLVILFGLSKRNHIQESVFNPIKIGLLVLFIGNILTVLPFINGMPTDIISSVIFVFILFYTLYRKKLFRLDLLISKWVVYGISGLTSVAILMNSVKFIEITLKSNFNVSDEHIIMFVAMIFTLLAFVFYRLMEIFIDRIYISDESTRNSILKDFKSNVLSTLEVKDISRLIVHIVKDTLDVQEIYVMLPDEADKIYRVASTSNPLNNIDFKLEYNNPLVTLLSNRNDSLLASEFRNLNAYKSLWIEEKKEIVYLGIECLVPLVDNNKLVGILMLTNKNKNGRFTEDDLTFLESINIIASTALSKAQLYETVYNEARKDDLTKLLNRKYFLSSLNELEAKRRDGLISIAIFNIDDFKLYNQLYGYSAGDSVLIETARIIEATMEGIGLAARYDSKVFACVFPNYDVNQTKLVTEKIVRQINEINSKRKNYKMKRITVSCGISTIPFLANNVTELINDAELAIYHVKRNGKNNIRISTGQIVKRNDDYEEVEHKSEVYSEYAAAIYALTAAIDTKDHYTFSHSNNVAYYATELAFGLNMDKDSIEIIKEAALLHDIGKIGIDENILNKKGRLTDHEREIMNTHVENSVSIIKHIPSLTYVIPAVIGHHERYDGNGYPRGVRGNDIPLFARILCIADSFDAMLSKRAYKDTRSIEFALMEVGKCAGTQFDPDLAAIFIELVKSGKIVPIVNKPDENYL